MCGWLLLLYSLYQQCFVGLDVFSVQNHHGEMFPQVPGVAGVMEIPDLGYQGVNFT